MSANSYGLHQKTSLVGHIAQLTQGTPAHNALHCQVGLASGRSLGGAWKRRPGRPRARWTDQLRNDTGSVPANLWRQAIIRGHTGTDGPSWLRDDDDENDDPVSPVTHRIVGVHTTLSCITLLHEAHKSTQMWLLCSVLSVTFLSVCRSFVEPTCIFVFLYVLYVFYWFTLLRAYRYSINNKLSLFSREFVKVGVSKNLLNRSRAETYCVSNYFTYTSSFARQRLYTITNCCQRPLCCLWNIYMRYFKKLGAFPCRFSFSR